MKRIIRTLVCMVLCFLLIAADFSAVPHAADFFKKVDMLLITSHIEGDAGVNQYATVQGACADGEYAYFAFMQGAVCNIAKFDAKTWEFLEKKQIINMGHSNDITYNSDKKYLVVVNNAPYYDVVTLINPDTLEPIKDVKIDEDVYSIAYNAKRKTYVVGLSGTYDFALLDSDFKVTKKFKGVNTGYTRQGGDCDDDYIYFVQSGGNNLLVIYDYEGNLVDKIPMDDTDEVENIFHIGNEYYTSLFYYGNNLFRIGFSNNSRIRYNVTYHANGGEGEMKPTAVNYGEKTELSPCAFTRPGYFFAGWKAQRTMDDKFLGYRNGSSEYEWLDEDEVFTYRLYDDEETVSSTVRFGGVNLYAVWYAEEYGIELNAGDGTGDPVTVTVGHDEEYTLEDNGFAKEEYIFEGYTAMRTVDNRVYGYRHGSEALEWLHESDVDVPYLFRSGESVKSMTPEGSVILTAQYKYAYTFGDNGSTLVEYVGVDEKVTIPSNDGELTTLAQGAIKDNEIMTDLIIPAGVNSLCKEAVSNCPKLRNIYFEGVIPEEIDGDCIVSDNATVVYEVRGEETYFVGFFCGQQSLPMLRCRESILNESVNSVTEE